MKKQRRFKLHLQSVYVNTLKVITENFVNEIEAIEFCKSHYKFYLWVTVNGKTVIDNTKIYTKPADITPEQWQQRCLIQ